MASLFNGDLGSAKIEDYRSIGIKAPNRVLMTEVNVPKRYWTDGFSTGDGNFVKTENGQALNEFFHLDLRGYLSLPPGEYQLATVSDDAVRVTLKGTQIISNLAIHAAMWDFSQKITFTNEDLKKAIRIEYFQGPRVELALQLLVRPWNQSNLECGRGGSFLELGPSTYSH